MRRGRRRAKAAFAGGVQFGALCATVSRVFNVSHFLTPTVGVRDFPVRFSVYFVGVRESSVKLESLAGGNPYFYPPSQEHTDEKRRAAH